MQEKAVNTTALKWCERILGQSQERIERWAPLRVEASQRKFYRLYTKFRQSGSPQKPFNRTARTLILMDSPPKLERNDQFCALAKLFHQHEVPVPEIVAQSDSNGWFLLTDLGETHLEDCYATTQHNHGLNAAVNQLPIIAAIQDSLIKPYDTDRLAMELDLFQRWFVAGMLGTTLASAGWVDVCRRLIESADMQPKGCIHRDYHCRNLLFESGKLGVVDFQDALHGPILYDIASLLRDCYYVFDEAEIDIWLEQFVSRTPPLKDLPPDIVRQWFDWIALQRQLKAVGIFSRLHLRDGKSSHLGHILPVLIRVRDLAQQYDEFGAFALQLNDCIKLTPAALAKAQ